MINVINLEKRKDRMEQFDRQAKEHGFEYRRWEGIVIPQLIFVGISRAHRQVVQDAKNRSLPKATIMEDDCVLSSINSLKYYWDNEPSEYDIYFGAAYRATIEDGKMLFGYSGNTFYTVHERFYDTFLAMKEMNHLDRELGRFAWKYNYRVCQPQVAYQSNGWSDNRLADENLEGLLEGIELYKG